MQQILKHPLTLISALIFTLFLLFSLDKSAHKATTSSAYVMTLEKERDSIAAEVTALQKKYADTQTQFTQEKILRDELLLQKKDEVIIQLPQVVVPAETAPVAQTEQSAWQQWKEVLFE